MATGIWTYIWSTPVRHRYCRIAAGHNALVQTASIATVAMALLRIQPKRLAWRVGASAPLAAAADYDNDGHVDLLVVNFGGLILLP